MSDGLHRVEPSDLPSVARSLARAFHDDPVFELLFGGSVPEDRAARFFRIMGTIRAGHGHVYSTPGHEAAAIWAPPDAWKTPLAAMARHTPGLLRVFGRRTIANLGVLTRMERHHPTAPHYYLEFLGTAPEHQGRGHGASLVTPMIERCDREGVGAYLESSKESNVAFYGRFGFEVTGTITHRGGVPMWLMWRDPR